MIDFISIVPLSEWLLELKSSSSSWGDSDRKAAIRMLAERSEIYMLKALL